MDKQTAKWKPEKGKGQTILIVDDEPIFVDALKVFISDNEENLNIITSNDGKNALEVLEKEKIDLMLLDINMPVLDGVQLLTELHRKDIWLPVIILSSVLVFPDHEGQIFEDFGIVTYIEKPVNLENLIIKVLEVLRPAAVYKKKDSETKPEEPTAPKSDFILHIKAELAKILGNSSKDIISNKMKDLGFSEYDFPATHAIDLVEKVCEEIEDKSKRIVFKKKMIEYFKNR